MSGLLHRAGSTSVPVAVAAGGDGVVAPSQQGCRGFFPAGATRQRRQDFQNHQVQDNDRRA